MDENIELLGVQCKRLPHTAARAVSPAEYALHSTDKLRENIHNPDTNIQVIALRKTKNKKKKATQRHLPNSNITSTTPGREVFGCEGRDGQDLVHRAGEAGNKVEGLTWSR